MATKLAGWKHRAEVAEAKVATLRVNCGRYQAERNEAVARLRDMAADRANRSAAS